MSDESQKFGVAEMAELAISAKKTGWRPGEFGTLANNQQRLSDMHDVTVGFAEIRHNVYPIDADSQPADIDEFEMSMYTKVRINVHKHTKLGELKCERRGNDLWLNGRKVALRTDYSLRDEGFMTPNQLRAWIWKMQGGSCALNANVAEFLRTNPHLYPQNWNGRSIFFPATVWRIDWGGKSNWKTLPEKMRWEFIYALFGGTNWSGGLAVMYPGVRGGEKHNIQRFLPPAVPVIE